MAPPAPPPQAIQEAGHIFRRTLSDVLRWIWKYYRPFFAASVSAIKQGVLEAEQAIMTAGTTSAEAVSKKQGLATEREIP